MAATDVSQIPSTAAIAIATAIVGVLTGYMVGQASSLGLFAPPWSTKTPAPEDLDSDDEDAQGELKDFDTEEEYKMVLVVRTDLGMTKGKMCAQCGHATLACYKSLVNSAAGQRNLRRWEHQAQAKVALQVKDEDELMLLQAQAVSLGLCAKLIRDAGRTQIAAGSVTVLGVGPGPKSVIDQVTGRLKLL